jgi:hypothetical protein
MHRYALPVWFRFIQCLWRIHEENAKGKPWLSHALNAIKYFLNIAMIFAAAIQLGYDAPVSSTRARACRCRILCSQLDASGM